MDIKGVVPTVRQSKVAFVSEMQRGIKLAAQGTMPQTFTVPHPTPTLP